MTTCSLPLLLCTLLSVSPAGAQSPKELLLRLSADAGGRYSTNVYFNAGAQADALGLMALRFGGDWLPSSDLLLRWSYNLDGEYYARLSDAHNLGQDLLVTLGGRPLESLYLFADAGGEFALVPHRSAYTMWGMLGRGGARWEVGESHTFELSYRVRSDQFPDYDLDNLAQRLALSWHTDLGDTLEFSLPLQADLLSYRERFLLDAAGLSTGEARTGQHLEVAPRLDWYTSFSSRLSITARFAYNASNDTYYFDGPFGTTDPAWDPELLQHFDSFVAGGGGLAWSWEANEALLLRLTLDAGYRSFTDRPAYDSTGEPTSELERDSWLSPSVEVQLRLGSAVALVAHYLLMQQWSNDALWNYTAHQASVSLRVWWEN